jgi:hypothetical protein
MMKQYDREVGLGSPETRDDGAPLLSAPYAYRKIGELLLDADELEETIRECREHPQAVTRTPESLGSVVRRLEHRLSIDRMKMEVLEQLGAMDYERIDRAMLHDDFEAAMRRADAAG